MLSIDRFFGCTRTAGELQLATSCQLETTELLNRAISGGRVQTWGVFECDISRRGSVAVLCMLYKIRCNPMHPLNGALPGLYVAVRDTRSALVTHRYAAARRRTSVALGFYSPLSVHLD